MKHLFSSTDGNPKGFLIQNAGFYALAVINALFVGVTTTATEDILEHSDIPTSANIITIGVYFVLSLFMPCFIDRVALLGRALAAMVLTGAGFIVMASGMTVGIRIVGVALVWGGQAFGEGGLLSSTSFYHDFSLSYYIAGNGLGGLAGAAFYTVLTTFLCVSSRHTLLVAMVILPGFPLVAWLVEQSEPSSLQEIKYYPIDGDNTDTKGRLTLREKVQFARENLNLALPFFLGMLASYIFTQSVVTTLSYKSVPFLPQEQYRLYSFSYMTALFVSQSIPAMKSWINPEWTCVTRQLWITVICLIALLLFAVLISWYNVFRSFILVLSLCFVDGVLEGAVYFNAFSSAGLGGSVRNKEFSRAFLTCAYSGGQVVAGLLDCG
ncbi:predicted protein [Nematostella vectensis]|uniref:Battenin n=2 Tax=Nematostella vectensis TaxID=45351 RepID=A7RSH3_NEMVE|nr:predicted protein [Nematostella vectensis]|eukprot:XP_001637699.1 predicted protein [Nematostella vectensis]